MHPLHSLNDKQKLDLASASVVLADNSVFRDRITPPPDTYMTRLLLVIYIFHLKEESLDKKRAGQLIGAQDVKTGRKYISRAIELGLVKIRKDSRDKRVDLLVPTEQLTVAAEDACYVLYYYCLDLLDLVLEHSNLPKAKRFPKKKGDRIKPARVMQEVLLEQFSPGFRRAAILLRGVELPPATSKTRKAI